jgi:hypothetical protein
MDCRNYKVNLVFVAEWYLPSHLCTMVSKVAPATTPCAQEYIYLYKKMGVRTCLIR